MTDPICVFGAWPCFNNKRFEQCKENKRKAELWDQYAIYDNEKDEEIPVKKLIKAYEQIVELKKLVAKGPLVNVEKLEECQQAIDDWLGKVMNVLEKKVNV